MATRRDLLWRALGSACLAAGGAVARRATAASRLDQLAEQAPRARYWVAWSTSGGDCAICHDAAVEPVAQHPVGAVRCLLCARRCLLLPGERGLCRARLNVDGELRSLVYGRPITTHTDPIEKKPFYHFLPGSEAFSLATSGCPLRCRFCQNWTISQAVPEDYTVDFTPPADLARTARANAPIVAFTYNEPTVFMEYLTDIARAARAEGLRAVLVSCGYMNEAPLAELCSVLDAVKIDLKGFSPDFYREVCGVELAPVLRSIEQVRKSGVHLELVNLVVPTLNDGEAMLQGLCRWVKTELGPDVPVHFTRFHPDYQLTDLPPTPVATLERAWAIARAEGLHYPYVGNVPGHPGNSTRCPRCDEVVVERSGFFVVATHLDHGACGFCGQAIAGAWS